MDVSGGLDHGVQASTLVRRLIDEHHPKYGVGSMTHSIYDTAWVSIITKSGDGETKWLFPMSFHYLIKHQQHDGGWAASTADGDAILNTMAALLALCRHIEASYQLSYIPVDELIHKKNRAVYFLEAKFSQWDATLIASPNFEILACKLLHLLEAHEITFSFPGRQQLLQRRDQKVAKLNLSSLYGRSRSILTHFLEGFIWEVAFDRLSHHKISGSMMASPASTAAYLMHCSKWDDEAEAYLNHVVSVGGKDGNGGVPSKYPSTVFEISSSVSLLLENGFEHSELSLPHLDSAASFLEDCLALESGVTGFAPYAEPDADNTARAISTLCLLGREPSSDGLTVRYETKEFFKTFFQDRNPSLRTNCLVLTALLDQMPRQKENLMPKIEKAIRFITNCWWTTNGCIEDDLNKSPTYAAMLMTQSLARAIALYDEGLMPLFDSDDVLRRKVFICLIRALIQTLQTQNSDGSWGRYSRCETTAYALLTLSRLSGLITTPQIKRHIDHSKTIARDYLSKNFDSSEPEQMWNEKTVSGSLVVYQALVLAALRASTTAPPMGTSIENVFQISIARLVIQTKYYGRQQWFADLPEWEVQAYLLESHLFLPQLRAVQNAVFPPETLTQDVHFDSIPFMWISTGMIDQRFIGPEFIYQMMILTFLNRQLEEYVSDVLSEIFSGCLFEIEDVIRNIFEEIEHFDQKDQCFCDAPTEQQRSSISTSGTISLFEARSVLYRYVSHVLNHPYVLMASHYDQGQLRAQLLAYLLGLLRRNSDSEDTEQESDFRAAGSNYTEQTSHQFLFAFLCCIVGKQSASGTVGLRREFLETPEQHYLVSDICRRLSVISVMTGAKGNKSYVDSSRSSFGSWPARAHNSKRNSSQSLVSSASTSSSSYSESLTSLSPISSISSAPSTSPTRNAYAKPILNLYSKPSHSNLEAALQLDRLLFHEYRCLSSCLESLSAADVNQKTLNIVKLFVDVCKVSGQILDDESTRPAQDVSNDEVIEQTPTADEANTPKVVPKLPERSARRGSVSAARAALEIAPLRPKSLARDYSPSRYSRSQSSDCASRVTLTPSLADDTVVSPTQDDIKLTGTTQVQREWNISKESTATHKRKISRSSIEIQRIERIMADMENVGRTAKTVPVRSELKVDSKGDQPNPKTDPMLPVHPALRYKPEDDGERIDRQPAVPTSSCSPNSHDESKPVMPHWRHQRSRSRPRSLISQFHSADPRRQRDASQHSRTRNTSGDSHALKGIPKLPPSSSSPSRGARLGRAMTRPYVDERTVTISSPRIVPRSSTFPFTARSMTATTATKRTKSKAVPDINTGGWIKAPPPTNNNGHKMKSETDALEAERMERMRKSRRASRLGGPKWRAPF